MGAGTEMVAAEDFDRSVPLPRGLGVAAIQASIEYIERELPELIDIYYEQMNLFSALVGIYGTRALDANSLYEKTPHRHDAQQRFPDLNRPGFHGDPVG